MAVLHQWVSIAGSFSSILAEGIPKTFWRPRSKTSIRGRGITSFGALSGYGWGTEGSGGGDGDGAGWMVRGRGPRRRGGITSGSDSLIVDLTPPLTRSAARVRG